MGCLKEKAIARQEKGEKLHFYVFDCLAWCGFNYMTKKAWHRFHFLMAAIPLTFEYVSSATYVSGGDLNILLQEILARGDEGVVITHKDGLYEPGKRPSKTTLKIKKELKQTIDCFFTGVGSAPTKEYTGKEIETWKLWYNTKTGEKLPEGEHFREYSEGQMIIPVTKGFYNDWAGSLEIGVLNTEGKIQSIGLLSNLTEDIKADPESVKGKVIEVTCMEIDEETKGLRHAKLVQFRPDLGVVDCTAEKVFG
jgi:ATP-dependent DNA ligase